MCLSYTKGFVPSVLFIEISMHDSNVSLYCCYIEELEAGKIGIFIQHKFYHGNYSSKVKLGCGSL